MAVRLCHVLILFGFIAFTSQRNVDWDEKLARDSKDLYKLQSLLSKLSHSQPRNQVVRKERTHPKKRQTSKLSHNEREDIKHLLDDLEREIKKNYQSQPVAVVEPSEEFTDETRAEASGYDSNSVSDDDSIERVATPAKPKKSRNLDRNQYNDMLSLLRCNCGFESDQNQVLRCAMCSRDTSNPPVNRARHTNPRSQSEHLLGLLNRYGKKYKLSDELDAIVIDVSDLESSSRPAKGRKKKVSPFPLVDSKPESRGLDLNSLQALEYLLQPQETLVKNPKYSPAVSIENVYPSHRTTHLGPANLNTSFFQAMMAKHNTPPSILPKSKFQKEGKFKRIYFKDLLRRNLNIQTPRLGIPFEINISGLSQKKLF